MTQYVWHAIRFDFSIYIFWHMLTLSISISSSPAFWKAFTDTALCTHYYYTQKNNLLVAWTWRFLETQYECIYNKSTHFFPFFFRWPLSVESSDMRPFKWMSVSVYACKWMRVAQWHHKTSTRVHKHTYHRVWYTFTYGARARALNRPKTSKLINFETKVEHARKINIKNSSLKHPVTPLFLFITYETNIFSEVIFAIFRCHCLLSVRKWWRP